MTSALPEQNAAGLDAALVNQTVPPGSMRYYALLFAPPGKRDLLVALHLLEDELATTGRSVHHDVAHTRLKWWHDELERLVKGNPAHPATRALSAARPALGTEFTKLKGLIDAAAIDLARVTFADEAELAGYFDRAGGVVAEFAARWLLTPGNVSPATSQAAARLGALIRRVDALRNLRSNALAGRVQLPLATLDAMSIDVSELGKTPWSPALQTLLQSMRASLLADIEEAVASIERKDRPAVRPLLVMAGLHARLLERIDSQIRATTPVWPELGPFDKLITSWRAARSAR
ncbi:MAG: squalene/phytoene synthase family protein [Steroidobacteraceae bacterium]